MTAIGSPTVECPHCSTSIPPEPLGHGKYRCDCCAKEFHWTPPPAPVKPEKRPSGGRLYR